MKKINQNGFKKLLLKLQKRKKDTVNYAFYFSPEDIGLTVQPTDAQVEKLGIVRALERLDRKNFFVTCMVELPLDDGQFPSKASLEIHREKARANLYNRLTSGETNEAIKSGVRTVTL